MIVNYTAVQNRVYILQIGTHKLITIVANLKMETNKRVNALHPKYIGTEDCVFHQISTRTYT